VIFAVFAANATRSFSGKTENNRASFLATD
jgi:hypothetical protein